MVKEFKDRIDLARNLTECHKAALRFESRMMGKTLADLETHGDPEQKKDLEALKQMVVEYHTLLGNLLASKKTTEDDLKRFEQGLHTMLERLQTRPKLQPVVKTLLRKNIADMTPITNTSGTRKLMSFNQLFTNRPDLIHFRKMDSQDCNFMLALLESSLRSGYAKEILNKIKIWSANEEDGYYVNFPGQSGPPVHVSSRQVNQSSNPNVVDSLGNWGPLILEQAFENLLASESGHRFRDPLSALKEIFGNHPPITIQATQPRRENPPIIMATFDQRLGAYTFTNHEAQSPEKVSIKNVIDAHKAEMQRRIANARQDDRVLLEVITDQDEYGRPVPRFKFKEPDHHQEPDHWIEGRGFPHSERKSSLQNYIRYLQNLKKSNQALPVQIWTATKIRNDQLGGNRYYSIRMADSTPDKICIVDPHNTRNFKKISIDDLLNNYNIAGICL
jgi:hypothetical protein